MAKISVHQHTRWGVLYGVIMHCALHRWLQMSVHQHTRWRVLYGVILHCALHRWLQMPVQQHTRGGVLYGVIMHCALHRWLQMPVWWATDMEQGQLIKVAIMLYFINVTTTHSCGICFSSSDNRELKVEITNF